MEKPARIKETRDKGLLQLGWRWFQWPGTLFSLVLGVLLVGFFVFTVAAVAEVPSIENWFLLFVILLPCIGVGLVALYASLRGFLNKTTIELRWKEGSQSDAPFRNSAGGACLLTVRHGPLPSVTRKNVEMEAENIRQLFLVKHSPYSNRISYELAAALPTGNQHIVGDIYTLEHAQYLEQAIEDFLGIQDREVAEEEPKK